MATARGTHRIRNFAAAAAVTLAWPALVGAQPDSLAVHRLTPAGQSWSDLVVDGNHEPVISADGKWVVYWFDGETDGFPDLYIASRFGGDVRRLSVPRPTGSEPIDSVYFEVSADSRFVVFRLDQETSGRTELWSVPVTGGPADAVKLSAPIPPTASVSGFELDGPFAVFPVLTEANANEFWSAPIDGSAPAGPLHGPLPPGASGGFTFDLANGRTVFLSDLATAGQRELWSVPSDGSAPPVRLNGDLVAGGDVLACKRSPDGQRVVYRADQRFDGVEELWSVPIAGPSTLAVRLSPDLPPFGDVRNWGDSSDGSRVLFRVDSGTDEQIELWSVPVAGPAASAVHLNIALVAGGDVSSFASRGDRVVYVADNAVDEQYQAFIVPIGGPFSASVRLHGNLPAGGDVPGVDIYPTSPQPTVLLAGDLRVDAQDELFTQHLDGIGTPYPILGDLDPGMAFRSECGGAALPDFSAVVVCADRATVGKVELWRLDIDFSSSPDRLSSPFAIAEADVTALQLSPDGRWVAFRADSSLDERFDLLRIPADGSSFLPTRVHAVPASGLYDVVDQAIWWTPESAGIVYAADHEVNGRTDLWISDGMIFRADFEWGDVEEWSSVTP